MLQCKSIRAWWRISGPPWASGGLRDNRHKASQPDHHTTLHARRPALRALVGFFLPVRARLRRSWSGMEVLERPLRALRQAGASYGAAVLCQGHTASDHGGAGHGARPGCQARACTKTPPYPTPNRLAITGALGPVRRLRAIQASGLRARRRSPLPRRQSVWNQSLTAEAFYSTRRRRVQRRLREFSE